MNEVLFSTGNSEWETPDELFKRLDEIYHFDVDVCATAENTKCEHYFSPEEDGLKQRWTGTCWMNPPYGREITKWVRKAYYSAKEDGATVVCLLPARVDTDWWHTYCLKAAEIYFLRGRLRFKGAKNSAPFPTAIVIFRRTVSDVLPQFKRMR